MAIIQGNAKQGSTRGFYPKVINGSLRFNDDDIAYLSWTPASAGNRKTWTFSCWAKRGDVSNAANEIFGTAAEGDKLAFGDSRIFWFQNGSSSSYLSTSALFRDPSAWYHIVFALDTTQATAANRCKLWVNGEFVAFDNNTTFPTQNYDGDINNTEANFIGRGHSGDSGTFDGYLANVHFIDGQALTASDFGETKNGVWVAKDYAGTFGTNGFYLTFEDDTQVEAFNATLHRGNGGTQSVTGTGFSPDLVWIKNRDNADNHYLYDTVRGANRYLNSDATGAEAYSSNDLNSFDSDGFTVGSDGGLNRSGQAIVAWCWDAGANNASTGHSSVTYTGNGGTQKISGLPFSPDLVWVKSRTQDEAQNHNLYDTVRGANVRLRSNTTSAEATDNNALMSFDKNGFTLGDDSHHNQSAETYVAWAWDAGDSDPVSNTTGDITSTVKASTTNGFSIVSYSGVAATDGSTNGGNPWGIGHGLTSAPDFVIYKMRTSSNGWYVYHSSLASTEHLRLDSTAAKATETNLFQNTPPDASELYVGGWDVVNRTGNNYIAYCFHDVTGKQKFGSYTGNGSATGPTVTTGFRVGWLMIKRTDTTSNWLIYDTSRTPFNPNDDVLFANTSGAEDGTSDDIEFTSTGFQLKEAASSTNASGGTYLYMAFAGSYSDYITDYNTDGSIDSRVKASDATGFSIVSYEGTGVNGNWGHGLSAAPDMVIVKNRDNGGMPWLVYHSSNTASPETDYLLLNSTAATTDFNTAWNDTSPTSTVFNVGTADGTNQSGYRHIAYCWAEKTGYSKFSSYSGTGSDHTSEISCGFRPAWIMIKRTDDAFGWYIHDATRDTDGTMNTELVANSSGAEYDTVTAGAGNRFSISDTGFTVLGGNAGSNASGGTYIYAAFADTREAAFWLDQSGNDNDWQPVNLDHNDTVADSPTNNFATFNPLASTGSGVTGYGWSMSDGNLVFTPTNASGYNNVSTSTMAMTSGKYYFEFRPLGTPSSGWPAVGLCYTDSISTLTSTSNFQTSNDVSILIFTSGNLQPFGSTTESAYGNAISSGDVLMLAVDCDNGKVWWGKNGTWFNSGNPTTGTNAGDTFTAGTALNIFMTGYNGAGGVEMNCGQQPFKYDPPA